MGFLNRHYYTIAFLLLMVTSIILAAFGNYYHELSIELTEVNDSLRDRVVEQNAQIEGLQNKISIQEEKGWEFE